MIGLLRALLTALVQLVSGEEAAADLAVSNKASLDLQLAAQSAAIEHLRALIEDDSVPTAVGAPTFIPGGISS